MLTSSPDDALLFENYPEAQAYSDGMKRHRRILEEVWSQRLVTQGWYVLVKNGRFLAAEEGMVHWVEWGRSRLFDSPAAIHELMRRMTEGGLSEEEFVDAKVHLRFASAPA